MSGAGPGDGTAAAPPLLSLRALSKSFGGLRAVQDVSLDLAPGRLAALIGPNGAGKTTLFALASGFVAPDAGRVAFDGRDVTADAPEARARAGMTRTFQIVQPFAQQTVRENIAVGAHLRRARRADALAHAEDVAAQVGLAAQLDKPAAALTVAGRKRLELARALATGPKLLLLDEVLAGLNPQEIDEVLPLVRALPARGVTVLMIEHVMQAVMNLAEQVWVLAEGRLIAQGTPRQVVHDPAVIRAYLGDAAAARLDASHGR